MDQEAIHARAVALQERLGHPAPFPRRDRARAGDRRHGQGDAGAGRDQAGRRRHYRRQGLARHLAELSRPEEFREVQGADRRRGPGQRVRRQRGVPRQAAGRRHRLGHLRADQLHDLDPRPARHSSSRSTSTKVPNYDISAQKDPRRSPRAPSTARSMPRPRTGAPPASRSTPTRSRTTRPPGRNSGT